MISLSEIQNRAIKFQKEWQGATYGWGEPHEIVVSNINGYLVNTQDIIISARSKPITPRPFDNSQALS